MLPAIDPAAISYQQWVDVGFALKDGGFTAQDWEDWSRRDAKRYHPGECVKKWASIRASGVTLGTLVKYARDQGWTPARATREDRAYGWDDVIGGGLQVIDNPDQVEVHPLPRLFAGWHPGQELSRYLELLFDSTDYVAYCVEVWQKDGRFMPTKGIYGKTAGDLLADIAKHGDDLGAVIGDANPEAGAWIRFNPFDGQGVRNENVTEYRYALLDMIELPVSEALQKAEADRAGIEICKAALRNSIIALDPEKVLSQDDGCSYVRTLAACERLLNQYEYGLLLHSLEAARARLGKRTAWRIEGTLREFERLEPVNVWFEYPVHTADRAGVLGDVKPEAEMKSWERGRQHLQENNKKQRDNALIDIRNAVDFSPTGSVAIRDLEILNKNGNPYSVDKISAWFGDGNSARPTYKKEFEKYLGDDGRAYLRRREDAEDTP